MIYYVSPTGSDSNTGDVGSPWLTIQHAANVAAAGDTVNVLPGTYISSAMIHSTHSGSSERPIVFQSTVQGGALLRSVGVKRVWQNDGDYVNIYGFDVSSDSAGDIGIITYGSLCEIKRNIIHDIPVPDAATLGGGGAVAHYNTGAEHDTTISENMIYNIGSTAQNFTHGIYYQQSGGWIYNNIIRHCKSWGINLYDYANSPIVENNLIFECGSGGLYGGGIVLGSLSDIDGALVCNNIIRDCDGPYGSAIHEVPNQTGIHNQYNNNCFYGGVTSTSFNNGIVEHNSVRKDPLMLNYQPNGSGDYHLTSSSPCKDAGSATGAPSIDYDGVSRPFGSGIDIGPYEYHT